MGILGKYEIGKLYFRIWPVNFGFNSVGQIYSFICVSVWAYYNPLNFVLMGDKSEAYLLEDLDKLDYYARFF